MAERIRTVKRYQWSPDNKLDGVIVHGEQIEDTGDRDTKPFVSVAVGTQVIRFDDSATMLYVAQALQAGSAWLDKMLDKSSGAK